MDTCETTSSLPIGRFFSMARVSETISATHLNTTTSVQQRKRHLFMPTGCERQCSGSQLRRSCGSCICWTYARGWARARMFAEDCMSEWANLYQEGHLKISHCLHYNCRRLVPLANDAGSKTYWYMATRPTVGSQVIMICNQERVECHGC